MHKVEKAYRPRQGQCLGPRLRRKSRSSSSFQKRNCPDGLSLGKRLTTDAGRRLEDSGFGRSETHRSFLGPCLEIFPTRGANFNDLGLRLDSVDHELVAFSHRGAAAGFLDADDEIGQVATQLDLLPHGGIDTRFLLCPFRRVASPCRRGEEVHVHRFCILVQGIDEDIGNILNRPEFLKIKRLPLLIQVVQELGDRIAYRVCPKATRVPRRCSI